MEKQHGISRRNRLFSLLMIAVMLFGMLPVTAFGAETVQISTEDDLFAFADRVNGTGDDSSPEADLSAVLTDDITITKEWTPIGLKAAPYSGTFDGQGHTITISGGIGFTNTTERYGFFNTVSGIIQNLTIAGTVELDSKAGNVGGVAGYLEKNGQVISCINHASISGKNNIGGIIGMSCGDITQCFNSGSITAASSSNAGGIVGSVASSATGTLSWSGNTGTITTKTTGAGGVAGSFAPSTELSGCYNIGTVVAGTNTAGGIVGTPMFSTIFTLVNCYNIGNISGSSNIGGIISKEMKDGNSYTNCFYLDISAENYSGVIKSNNSGIPSKQSKDELKTAVLALKDANSKEIFVEDSENINEGWPILAWQASRGSSGDQVLLGNLTIEGKVYVGGTLTASYTGEESVTYQWYRGNDAIDGETEAFYTVSIEDIESALKVAVSADGYTPKMQGTGIVPNYVAFDVQPDTAEVTVTDSEDNQWEDDPDADGFYALPVGDYTYTVSAGGEYEDASGSFSVPYTENDGMVSITLPVKTYDVTFAVIPSDAFFVVKKAGEEVEPVTPGTKNYQLAKGEYTFSASAFGYESKTDETFSVSGPENKNIELHALARYEIAMDITKAVGGPDTEPTVVIRDSDGMVRSYTQGLPPGDYTYSVSCGGYQSLSGSFTVSNAPVNIQETLSVQTAWDGSTLEEPNMDAQGVYLIGSAAELYWFASNAPLDADARLIADITVNEDISADEETLYQWTPMGTSSKKYTGSFDGGGYTISGIYINHTANGAGFFGYIDKAAEVSNLTIDGKIIGSKNYTGGVVGDCCGTVFNCHNLAEIQGYQYVGGVIGDLENGGAMSQCSNRGKVTASGHTAGGVVGRIDSGSSSAVKSCYNTGAVQGSKKVGGVVGDQYAYGSAVSNVYNLGAVTATDAAGYAGGILGNFRSGTLENAYMASANINGSNDSARGKIAGNLEANGQQKTFSKVYYLAEPAFDVIGNLNNCTIQNGTAEGQTTDQLRTLANALGDAFAEDTQNINDGYPILKWQTGEGTSSNTPESDPSGWDGETVSEPVLQDGFYQIGSAEELAWFANQLETYASLNGVLIADIDLNHRPWIPMCNTTEDSAYTGTFDGQSYTIRNLYISGRKPGTGLFAGNAGSIQNLSVAGQVHGVDYTASIASYNYGSVDNCHSSAAVSGGNYVGGITAWNMGAVSGCSGSGRVHANKYAGGVVASNKAGGVVTRCYHTGLTESKSDFSGGVSAANEGDVSSCYNTGIVLGHAANLRSYVGGVVGWNNKSVSDLYNTGSVVSMGSHTGGVIGISTSGTTAENLYGIGSTMGMYYDDDDYEQYYVGAVVGRKADYIANIYYLNSLAVTGAGTAKSEGDMKVEGFPVQLGNGFTKDIEAINGGYPILSWQTPENTPAALPQMHGQVTISGNLKPGSTLTASYTGDTENPIYIWYTADEDGEYVLAIGDDSYQVPVDQVGQVIRVKVLSAGYRDTVSGAAAAPIEGMNGSVSISGSAVVGKTLTATYSRAEDEPAFQWYRGNTEISGATSAAYTITSGDVGYLLKVRVTGNKAGYVEKVIKSKVVTPEQAGVWPDADCEEPANVGGVYVITGEKELHWFVSEVNSGNTAIEARLGNNLTLTSGKWYPIGTDSTPFVGTFDGSGKSVSNFSLTGSEKDEQGFFGVIGGNGIVKNVTVNGIVSMTGEGSISVGGIVGYVEGRVTGCTFHGSVTGHTQVGGIAGSIGLHGMVTECRNTAAVTGSEQIGGIAGASSYGDTYYCVNNGNIGDETARNVGGIVGDTQNYAVITGCYNTGDIVGSAQVGGISGKVYVASAPLGCYSAGSVVGGLYTGGVLGSIGGTDYIPTVQGSFYLNTLPKDDTATSKSERDMKASSFVLTLNSDAYVDCYVADNGTNHGYPILKWEAEGHSESSGGNQPSLPTKERIEVSFTLLGDTVHGDDEHPGGTVTWIKSTTVSGLPNTTTAYDLFRRVLAENGYTYEATGKSYVSFITSPSGVRLGEFSNGAYSGWMYTINGVFPDYMSSVTLKDGDDMVFFFTDDYRQTGWNPNGRPGTSTSNGSYGNTSGQNLNRKAVNTVIDLIKAIGEVTEDSGSKIEAARKAYDKLTDIQKKMVDNYEVLTAAEAAFAKLNRQSIGLPFTDIDGHWALDSIAYAYEKGLMNGVGDTLFSPEDAADRGMIVTILYRLEGSPAVDAVQSFDDVASCLYCFDAIQWAAGREIVKGYGNGHFEPGAPITREELAAILYRYAEWKGIDTHSSSRLTQFTDRQEISGWALEALTWANESGLITGTSETTVSPQGTATRAQLATILMRFCESIEK